MLNIKFLNLKRYFKNHNINIMYIAIGLILITSCKNYEQPISYRSPNNKFIIDIVTELQFSNDSDPIWQHISIRKASQTNIVLPGNLYKISAYNKPTIKWVNNDTLTIVLMGQFGQSFNYKDTLPKIWNGINVISSVKGEIIYNEP